MGASEKWHGFLRGLICSALFFLLYINDLSKITSDTSNSGLFADDTNIVIKILVRGAFGNNINEVLREINELFQINLLSLNYDKTYFLQFVTKRIKKSISTILWKQTYN
jgi:hypothetical protein